MKKVRGRVLGVCRPNMGSPLVGVVSQTLIRVWGLAGESSDWRLVTDGQFLCTLESFLDGKRKLTVMCLVLAKILSLAQAHVKTRNPWIHSLSLQTNTLSFTNSHKCVEPTICWTLGRHTLVTTALLVPGGAQGLVRRQRCSQGRSAAWWGCRVDVLRRSSCKVEGTSRDLLGQRAGEGQSKKRAQRPAFGDGGGKDHVCLGKEACN